MAEPTYEFRKYTPEFRDQIVELQKGLWSGDAALNSAHLRWKYERNPYLDEPLIYMALHEGVVVGMRGVYGAQWLLGEPGRVVSACSMGDLVVAADHQARFLPRRIMQIAEDDVRSLGHRYLLNFSASPATYLHSIRMGWRDLGPFATMVRLSALGEATRAVRRFVDGRRSLCVLSRRLQRRADSLAILSSRTAEHRFARLDDGPARQGPIVVTREPRPSAMAGLVDRVCRGGRMRHQRDDAYLGWRFRNPLSTYRFLFWGDRDIEGYLVLETPRRAYQTRVRIVDWEASAHEPRAELLRAAIRRGRFVDLRVWSVTLPPECIDLLVENGFAPAASHVTNARHRHGLLVKDLGGTGNEPLPDLNGWELRMAFSDKC